MPFHDYLGLLAVAFGILRYAFLALLVPRPDDTTMGRIFNSLIKLFGSAYLIAFFCERWHG